MAGQETPPLVVLGAGVAGLAVGHYTRQARRPCLLLEASPRVGGQCVTQRHGPFLYDLGAHRFHDQDPEITRDVQTLLGPRLREVHLRSHIHLGGRLVDFPPSSLNLLRRFGPRLLVRAACELTSARLADRPVSSFEARAVRSYGRTLAELLLLGYSQKLWGLPAARLSPAIGGGRLNGLGLGALLREALPGRRRRARHLDGAFFYPDRGIGVLSEALAASVGSDSLRLGARVTRIHWHERRIVAVEVNGRERQPVGAVVSTLPLDRLLGLLEPAPEARLLDLARSLRFRHLLLAAFFIDRPTVTRSATVYFPDPAVPFTRLYEPRNRSVEMSPAGQTSLVAEIPCWEGDALWTASDEVVLADVRRHLLGLGWFQPAELLGAEVTRARDAYPVLELGAEERVAELLSWLGRFENLRTSGRAGRFHYTWAHVLLRQGREIAADDGAARLTAVRVRG